MRKLKDTLTSLKLLKGRGRKIRKITGKGRGKRWKVMKVGKRMRKKGGQQHGQPVL